jgi:hypothetical protein
MLPLSWQLCGTHLLTTELRVPFLAREIILAILPFVSVILLINFIKLHIILYIFTLIRKREMPRKRKHVDAWITCIACKKKVVDTDASWSQHIRFNPLCGKVTRQIHSDKNRNITTQQKASTKVSTLKAPPNEVLGPNDGDKPTDDDFLDKSDIALMPNSDEEIIAHTSEFASLPTYYVPTYEDSSSDSNDSIPQNNLVQEDSKPPAKTTTDNSNISLLQKQQEQKQQTHVNDIYFPIGQETQHSIELMNICKEENAPLYMFERVQNWSRKTHKEDPTYFEGPSIKHQNILNNLDERYCSEG